MSCHVLFHVMIYFMSSRLTCHGLWEVIFHVMQYVMPCYMSCHVKFYVMLFHAMSYVMPSLVPCKIILCYMSCHISCPVKLSCHVICHVLLNVMQYYMAFQMSWYILCYMWCHVIYYMSYDPPWKKMGPPDRQADGWRWTCWEVTTMGRGQASFSEWSGPPPHQTVGSCWRSPQTLRITRSPQWTQSDEWPSKYQQLRYSFFSKPMAFPYTIMETTALAWCSQCSSLAQEVMRRMCNTDEEVPQEERERIIRDFLDKLRRSGQG